MSMLGKYPAVVRAYDQDARQCRVEIPGITDGAEVLPLAELCYALGDKSEHTEVRILVGDRVWVEFEAGDRRYPIIVGFRPKNTGNASGNDWRRWHHKNIGIDADEVVHITCKSAIVDAADAATINTKAATVNATDSVDVVTAAATVDAASVDVTADTVNVTATASATIAAPAIALNGAVTITGGLTVTGAVAMSGGAVITGTVTLNGINFASHVHPNPEGGVVGPPQAPP